MELKERQTINNNLEASKVNLLNEYMKLCHTTAQKTGCYRWKDNCYECDLHFKQENLCDELRLYGLKLKE